MGVKEQADGATGHSATGLMVESWKEHAACKGQDIGLFFPANSRRNKAASKFCENCLVSELCLNEALTSSRVLGIWGGTTWKQRRQMRKRKNVRLY